MHLCPQAEAAGSCVSGGWEEGCPPLLHLGVPVSHIRAQPALGMPAKFASCLCSHPLCKLLLLNAAHLQGMRSRWKAPSLQQLLWDTLENQFSSYPTVVTALQMACLALERPAWFLIADGDSGLSAREKGSDKGLTQVAQINKMDTRK